MNFEGFLNSVVKTDVKNIKHTTQPKPFVKWVGGKRSIMQELLQKIPKHINNYYEPFTGGGALFFEIYNMVNDKCYLSDLNIDLVISYITIQKKPQELIKQLELHQL